MISKMKYNDIIKFIIIYSLVFSLICTLGFMPFLLNNKTFIWNPDGTGQYYPVLVYISRFYKEFFTNLFNGQFNFKMFDFSVGFGEDVISSLNHYGITDPLNLLLVFCDNTEIEKMYSCLIILRLYLCGISFYAFCKYFNKNYKSILVGALVYLFSGFTFIAGIEFPNFLNCMIYLPLLSLGMEKIINNESSKVFIIFYFLSALNGFYFLYMETIFLMIYAAVRVLGKYGSDVKTVIKKISVCTYNYISAFILSSIILFPCILGFFNSPRAGNETEYNWFLLPISDIIRNIYGMFNIYRAYMCISLLAIALISILVLFILKDKNKSLKIGVIISVVLYMFNFTGIVFNGFSNYTNRYIFILIFVFSLVVVFVYNYLFRLNKKNKATILALLLVYVLFSILIGIFKNSLAQALISCVSIGLLMTVIILGNNNFIHKYSFVFVLFIVSGNAVLNMNVLYDKNFYGFSEEFSDKLDTYNEYFDTEDIINKYKNDEYKISTLYPNPIDNLSICNDYNGTGRYLSIANKNTFDFMHNINNASLVNVSTINDLDNRTIISTLLGNKYCIVDSEQKYKVPYGYKKVESGVFDVYENEYTLPFGYTYSSATDKNEVDLLDGVGKQEAYLSSAVVEDNIEGLSNNYSTFHKDLDCQITDCSGISIENNKLIVEKEKGTVDIEFNADENEEAYICLDNFNIIYSTEGNDYIALNVKTEKIKSDYLFVAPASNYFLHKDKFIINLGHCHSGKTKATITIDKPCEFSLDGIKVYSEDLSEYGNKIEKLKENSIENVTFKQNKVTGNINLPERKLLCMRIPYSDGWTAVVDGSPVEIVKVNDMFSGLVLDEGYHSIEFRYFTPGLKLGMVTSIIGILNLICYYIVKKVVAMKNCRQTQ